MNILRKVQMSTGYSNISAHRKDYEYYTGHEEWSVILTDWMFDLCSAESEKNERNICVVAEE